MAGIWRNLSNNKKLINEAARRTPLIVFDTETTGLGKNSEIIELAAVKCLFKNKVFYAESVMDVYIKPQNPVPQKASDINGITNEFLADKPEIQTVFPAIKDFFGDTPSVCAYNSAFDIRQMKAMYERQGSCFNISLDVDFYKIAKDVFCCDPMPDLKLGTIANTYGVDKGLVFHSALDDVWALIRVMNAIIKDINNSSDNSNDVDVKVNDLYFSEGYRGNTRLYLNTSSGRIYYAFKNDKWISVDKDLDLKRIRMDRVEKQVFDMTGAGNYKELKQICLLNGTGRMVIPA